MSTDAPPPHRVVPPSRRRDKPILSCSLCRRRKLKCDRQQPCKTCVDRGLSLSCTYARNIPASGASPTQEAKAPQNVHGRIDQLERLVTALMGSKSAAENDVPIHHLQSLPRAHVTQVESTHAQAEIPGTPDQVKLGDNTTTYTNAGHWTSILDGIAELKEHLDDIPSSAQPTDAQEEITGPDLLFGRNNHATLKEILAGLPSKSETDEIIITYFASMDLAPAIIHKPKFLREYDKFWQQPFDTPVMWIGLLFSILGMGSHFQNLRQNYQNGMHDPIHMTTTPLRQIFYREKVVQCLILANYSKCPPGTVETLIQYFILEYLRSRDTQFSTWILIGIIVRTALRMGYHREPSRFSNITPFVSEMRRRCWTMIVQLDMMSSSQIGLPRMIQPALCDTQEPRNLLDDDFDEGSTELPPGRPLTDATPMLYTLVRNRVLNVFARIADLTNKTAQPDYRNIMELDAALRAVYDNIPQSMKAIRALNFDQETSDITMRRLYLGLTFMKASLMLHRPYLLLGRTDSRYEYSRTACLDAALEILDFQQRLDKESKPGGKIWCTRWQVWSVAWRTSAIINHDFLLATTVLSLDLDKDLVAPMPVTEENITDNRLRFKRGQPTRAEIVEALTSAYDIWIRASETSRDAKRVAAAVKLVLGKANASAGESSANITTSQFDTNTSPSSHYSENFANASLNSTLFDITDPNFVPPFPMNDLSMDFGGGFDWTNLETDLPMPNFENSGSQYS